MKVAIYRQTLALFPAADGRDVASEIGRDFLPGQVDAIDGGRASHGLESNFLFGNNFAAPSNHLLNAADLTLFSSMSGYWARFAEVGDPNDPGTPVPWPRYSQGGALSDRHLVLDTTIGEAGLLRDEDCNFWEHYFLRSLVGTVPAWWP